MSKELHLNKLIFLICITTGIRKVDAQTLNDPIYLSYQYISQAETQNNPRSLALNSIEFSAISPAINLGSKARLYHALYGRSTSLNSPFTLQPTHPLFPLSLYDFRYSLILRAELSPSWEAVILPRILLRSDFAHDISNRDFVPYLVALANYSVNKNPNFKIGIGLALNNDFSHNAIIPTGTLYYDSKKIKIEIAYPSATIMYKQSQNFEYGFFANLDASISRVSANPVFLKSIQVLLAPSVSYRIYKNFFGHIKAGATLWRSMSLLDIDYQPIPNSEYSLNPSIFVRAGISYRINPN